MENNSYFDQIKSLDEALSKYDTIKKFLKLLRYRQNEFFITFRNHREVTIKILIVNHSWNTIGILTNVLCKRKVKSKQGSTFWQKLMTGGFTGKQVAHTKFQSWLAKTLSERSKTFVHGNQNVGSGTFNIYRAKQSNLYGILSKSSNIQHRLNQQHNKAKTTGLHAHFGHYWTSHYGSR